MCYVLACEVVAPRSDAPVQAVLLYIDSCREQFRPLRHYQFLVLGLSFHDEVCVGL